ncbi:MAG TPA: PQQ-binding-like beta-propeller repeat protein, partial [Candidatus Thalassarchaeaceae archaeon]|nr:PQQ-binding-like beta-propeller repeat protein [Candidatus Thalassarchaeaceae archaeon]
MSASCTAVSLKEGSIVAGSKDGLLISWLASTGEEVWRLSIEGPVSDIARSRGHVFVTASSSLYAIDDSDGSILWKRELEGASDYVLAVEGSIWATSSVYEIEVGDYTESSIWRFNLSGELGKRWVIPERSWFIGLSYGNVILGLGRPRCGVLSIDDDELEHFEVEDGLPIVCGDYRTEGECPIA